MSTLNRACGRLLVAALTFLCLAFPASAGNLLQGDGEGSAAERFAGLYHGQIVYAEGSAELEIILELAPGPEGELVGVVDMPYYEDLTNKPLEDFAVDGREIAFAYRHFSEIRGPDARYAFEAELSRDGRRLTGTFLEQRGRVPLELTRIGEPGDPRPAYDERPLADLADGGDALRTAFNARRDEARVILLLSPT